MSNKVDHKEKAIQEATKLYAHASQPENIGDGPGLVREFTVDSIVEFWEESQETVPPRQALSDAMINKLEPLVRAELIRLNVPN